MTSYIFPPTPQDVLCSKCKKNAVVAVNLGRPGVESDCTDPACPIANDLYDQANGPDGTLICFPDEHSDE